jgi:hypothetical protein
VTVVVAAALVVTITIIFVSIQNAIVAASIADVVIVVQQHRSKAIIARLMCYFY